VYCFARELPDFLFGVVVCILCADDGELRRHAVAYGAEVVEQPSDQSVVVADEPIQGCKEVVSKGWLVECFKQKTLVPISSFVIF
jgi:hypothetical protein